MDTKAILREAAVFSAGALCGTIGTSTFFYFKYGKVLEEQNAEIERIKSDLGIVEKRDEEEEMEEETDEDESKSEKALLFESLRKDAEQKTDYTSMSSDYVSKNKERPKTDVEERMEEMVKVEHPEDDVPTEPFEISIDEFMDDNFNDKIGMRVYEDGTLVADGDETASVEGTIGEELYGRLMSNAYPDGMYIRNPNISTDFEIFKEEGNAPDGLKLNDLKFE